jgi:serine/threonine protein kinase
MKNIISKKYKLIGHLGKGQFGFIYKAQCIRTDKIFAVKLENQEEEYTTLKHEATILHHLNTRKCHHIPYIYYYGRDSPYNCLVITYYEGSLTTLRETMTFEEIIIWWNQMLRVLGHIHRAGIVHRDIKPDHFMKHPGKNEWNLIDFGLATSFLIDGEHIQETPKSSLVGSPNYVSLYVHLGKDPVRRDDFISLIYVLWELLCGELPTGPTHLFERNLFDNEFMDPAHIYYPFNAWLCERKRWSTLYTQLEDYKNDNTREILYAVCCHGEHLAFNAEPQYQTFQVSVVEPEITCVENTAHPPQRH